MDSQPEVVIQTVNQALQWRPGAEKPAKPEEPLKTVLSMDVGWRRLGWCLALCNAKSQVLIESGVEDLMDGCVGFDWPKVMHTLARFLNEHIAKHVSTIDQVIVESQDLFRPKELLVERNRRLKTLQQGLCFAVVALWPHAKVAAIKPTLVKEFFGTRTETYRGNKKRARMYVAEHFADLSIDRSADKCDAWLQIVYFFTQNN